jgi:type II secretory pathway component PulC
MLLLLLALSVDDVIVKRNIFCSGCTQATTAATTAPRVELLSTLVCPREPAFSRALLRQDGELRLYSPGDRVGAARLLRVMSQSVELSLEGRNWRIFLKEAAPATATTSLCENGRCTLARAEVDKMVTHPELLAARAVATPDGFILRFSAASPLRQLGLKDGDRLRAIDGVNLDGMDAVLHLWPKLRSASRFTLSLVRDGKPLTYEVTVN